MAKTKEQKIEAIKNLEELFKKAKSAVMIDYYGLKVKEVNQLRRLLKEAGCNYLVAKKTLLNRVLGNLGLKDINLDKLTGGLGLVFGLGDEVIPAKLVVQFNKEHEKMKIHGGLFSAKGGSASLAGQAGGDLEFIDAQQIQQLSKLPTKDQMRAQIVWLIKSPLAGLVNVFQGNLRNLVYALGAIKKKKS